MKKEQAVGTVLAIFLVQPVTVKALDCFVTQNSRMVQTVCRSGETCCGSQCCPITGHFYTHWYFWLAVSMFLALVFGFAVSAFCHFRRERKYKHFFLRTKPQVVDGFFLDYNKAMTDIVSLPLYEELENAGTINRGAEALPPPPPYCDIDIAIDKDAPGSSHYSPSLPPSYTQTMLSDEASSDGCYDAKLIADAAPTVV